MEVAALVVFNCGMAGFAWYDARRAVLAFHAVFCSFVGRPKIFGIVVDVDWKVEIPQAQFLDKFDVPVVLRQVRSVLSVYRPWRSHRCRSWLCY